VAVWHSSASIEAHVLPEDGTLVASLGNGDLVFLRRHGGQDRIELTQSLAAR
jgi:hypothetical protein